MSKFSLVETKTATAIGGREDKEAREGRMRTFWSDPSNKQVFYVGKLLSMSVDGGETGASILASNGQVEIGETDLVVNGRTLPLPAGFTLSLANLESVWACPACKSAHGSGVRSSRAVDVKLLADCKFYYNPQTKALFTISSTCFGDYVKGLGFAGQVVAVPAPKQAKGEKGEKAA